MAQTYNQQSAIAITKISDHAEKRALNNVAEDLNVKDISSSAPHIMGQDQSVHTAATTCGDDVRVLTLDEYKPAAYSLALAFWEDHSSMYFIRAPDTAHWSEQQKWDIHLKMMEYITYAHLLKGLVVSAGPNYDCVALWMPPGQNMDDYYTMLRSGMWRLTYQLSPLGRDRFFNEFLPLLTTTKRTVLSTHDQDSWYLVYIGTKPCSQGRGLARKAITYVTTVADRDGKLCYLESSSARNREIYGRYGFVVRKEIWLQRGRENVGLDIMVREPGGRKRDSDADSGVFLEG